METNNEESIIFEQSDLFSVGFPIMEEIRRQGKLCDVTLEVRSIFKCSTFGKILIIMNLGKLLLRCECKRYQILRIDCVVTWCIKVVAVVVDIFGGYLWSNCHDVFKTMFNYDVQRIFSDRCLKSSQIPHCSSLLVWYANTWRKRSENFVIKI
jgi:hypothetical protein